MNMKTNLRHLVVKLKTGKMNQSIEYSYYKLNYNRLKTAQKKRKTLLTNALKREICGN